MIAILATTVRFNRNIFGVLLLASFFLSAPSPALAEGFYAGIQYAFLQYEQDGLDEANPSMLAVRGGLGINDHVAFEARLGFNAADDSTGDRKVRVDMSTGLYAKANIIKDAMISPYAIGGWTYLDIGKKSDHDISYGVGVDISAEENFSINIEYMELTDNFDNAADISSVQLGFTYKF